MSAMMGFKTQSGNRIVAGVGPRMRIVLGTAAGNDEPTTIELDDGEAAHVAWVLAANLKLRGAPIRQPILDEFHDAVREMMASDQKAKNA